MGKVYHMVKMQKMRKNEQTNRSMISINQGGVSLRGLTVGVGLGLPVGVGLITGVGIEVNVGVG